MVDLKAERTDVQQQLAALSAKMRELNNSIDLLGKRINPDSPTPSTLLVGNSRSYANISVRWAILDTLQDSGPMTTADIAERLKAAGVMTRAANFANNVSAVLSTTMKERHQEVQQSTDGKWSLNENGKQAISHIRTTPKFRAAVVGKA
jgi:hypothetical protein